MKKILTFLLFLTVLTIYVIGLGSCTPYSCPTYSKKEIVGNCNI
jgi:hypothetical protein